MNFTSLKRREDLAGVLILVFLDKKSPLLVSGIESPQDTEPNYYLQKDIQEENLFASNRAVRSKCNIREKYTQIGIKVTTLLLY